MEVKVSKGNHPKSYTKTTTQDYDHNGVPENITTETFVYDRKGQLVEEGRSYDWDGDGVIGYNTQTLYTYDKQGRVTQKVYKADEQGDGVVDYTDTTKNTYDKNNLIKTETIVDYSEGDSDYLQSTFYTYKKGLLTSVVTQWDWDLDTVPEQTNTTSYFYDGKRLAKETHDSSGDGIVDYTITYTPVGKDKKSYDQVTSYDYDANGVIDRNSVEKFVYDRKGQLTSQTRFEDPNGDGVPDEYWVSQEYTYDKQGRVIKDVLIGDEYFDGTPDYVATVNTTYDKKGNVVRKETIMDYADDISSDYQYVTDYVYDKGLLRKAVTNWEWTGDETTDQTDTVSYVYEGKDLIREEYDYVTDGLVEVVTSYDYLSA